MAYPKPAFKVTLDEQDVTGKIASRLVSMTLAECRGEDSDQLDIVLNDSDGLLAFPRLGARINVQIGWADTGLVDKGVFTVDEIEYSGAPDLLTLRARTATAGAGERFGI